MSREGLAAAEHAKEGEGWEGGGGGGWQKQNKPPPPPPPPPPPTATPTHPPLMWPLGQACWGRCKQPAEAGVHKCLQHCMGAPGQYHSKHPQHAPNPFWIAICRTLL
jgi:hypothetical protein